MARNSIDEENIKTTWTPDLFGPIFNRHSLTLKQVLDFHNVDEQIHRMAAFVPDEIIYVPDLSEKSPRSFQAVLMFLNISGFSMLLKKFIDDKNEGTLTLSKMLNNYIYIAFREIYCSDGDILKFSVEGLLAAWKVHDGEFTFDVVQKVISSAMNIQDSIAALKDVNGIYKVNVVISAGDVTFSVIGSNKARHFVLVGSPVEELKNAKGITLPNDLILSLSAWQHCTPSQYEYIIKDSRNVKITRVLKQPDVKSTASVTAMSPLNDHVDQDYRTSVAIEHQFVTDDGKSPYRPHLLTICEKLDSKEEIANMKEKASTDETAITKIAAENPNFSGHLRSYLINPVIQQIDKGESFLAEIRRVTIIAIDIIPEKCSNNELILLVDKCFMLLQSIVAQYGGCINTMDLYEKNIFLCIAFGIRGYCEDRFEHEISKNGIICATNLLRTTKTLKIQGIFVGISTGLAYCGVIGHNARRYYAIIGPPVDKAIKIMETSYDKVSCDYDTVLHSHFRKDQFRSRGVRTLQLLKKYPVYEYIGDAAIGTDATSLNYCYPILGRQHELEYFDEILDEIGLADRKCSGVLIEGIDRSGKSRLLDAFVTSVCNRQIRPIKLSLHATCAEKDYSVIYHIILQIFEAEDCETVEEREKELLNKLGDILSKEDFCYLNDLMRVRFPLSDTYCTDTDWRRHMKTIDIFETILKQLKTKICILLDDIEYMDHRSWQFLSSALDNCNIVAAMTMPKPSSWDDLSYVEAEIYKDKRLTNHILLGLDVDLLPIFACQFLNVLAIPKKLSRILQRRKDGHIGWCEAFLTSILQSDGLDFIKITPDKVTEHDFVFPNGILVTKIPVDLTPEELAPPLSWSQISLLDVCVINENYSKITDEDRDMPELMSEIYDRMNPYEQDFIKCAATLGGVFKRSMLENVMLNAIPLHTTKTVSEMIRLRILECASLQRQNFHEDLIFYINKKRRTFSDMHHSLSCNCHHSRTVISHLSLPLHAHCKMLEFRMDLFCKMTYNIQTNEEKQKHHTRAAKMYGLDARKCNSCGSGSFFRILSKDVLKESEKQDTIYIPPRVSLIRRRTIIEDRWMTARPSIILTQTTTATRKQKSIDINKVSIMPTSTDDKQDKDALTNEKNEKKNNLGLEKQSIFDEMTNDPSHPTCLEKFSHIDYRNCQCDNVISHLFSKLHQHIEKSGEINKVLEFFIEYSTGMIQIAQPLYAIKLLSIAFEKSRATEVDEWSEEDAEDSITNKGIILALMGDAHSALGNYDQAKKYYFLAVKLRGTPPKEKGACCNVMSKMLYKLQDPPHYTVDKESQRFVLKKLEFASYLRRLCDIFIVENKLKAAQSFALKSFRLAFTNVNSFLERGEIYLATVRVLHCTRNIKLVRRIERLMLNTINRKHAWNDAEEITMVANIYLTMYQIRVLRGELEEAVNVGRKVLKISAVLHLNKLMLITMPSLIQIMLWTRRINKAVDLLTELYFLADEDMDLSAKTWYYALSLDFMLDAGVVLESYKTSYNYYKKFIAYRSKFCLWRDPQSLCRLLTSLWMYQLRMEYSIATAFAYKVERYIKDVTWHDFSQILTCSKGFECYLMILLRSINTKHSNELLDLTRDISKIIKCLKSVSKHARVIKPRLYLLMAYLNVLRGRKSSTQIYLYKAQKFATLQENQLMMAWIMQNKKTWKSQFYNIARYWLEYVGSTDIVAWQYICNFNVDIWSIILYPLPTPDAHL